MDYGLTVEEQNEINGWKDQVMADIKIRCPKLLAEFQHLKEERKKICKRGFNWYMRTLQMDMIYGPQWDWGIGAYNLPQFSEKQIGKIDKVASKFFEQREMEMRRDNLDERDWVKLLMRELEKTGIKTKGSEYEIFWQTFWHVNPKTNVFDMVTGSIRHIHPTNNFYALENGSDEEYCMPDELKYY